MIDVEQLLISKIIEDGNMVSVLDANIKMDFFQSSRGQQAWEWVYGYWARHRAVPGFDAFRRKFPSFDLVEGIEEPITALVEELLDRHQRRLVQEGLQEAVTQFDETHDPKPTLESLQRLVARVNLDVSHSTAELAEDFIGDLVQSLVNPQENPMSGIPTGFSIIDEACGGLLDEQLVTLIGLPKRMKSSFLLYMAMTAQFQGYRAGLISFEMSNAEQKARYASLGAHVNLTSLLRGTLTDKDREKLFAFEEEVLNPDLGSLILIHDVQSATTVGGVAAKLEQHELDIVFIDGVYLMEDELGEEPGSPQALTNITRSLKRMAQRKKLVVVCSTQALFARTTRKRGVDMNSIGYSSSFAQDSDILLGIDRDDLTQPVARLKVIAARNALGAESEVSVDYNIGRVHDRGVTTAFDAAQYVSYAEEPPEGY